MKLRQLRAVLAVARWGSMSAAAQAMNLSQPAISRIVSLLEDDLQVRLFRRIPEGTEPTREGERLIRVAATAFRHLAAIEGPVPARIDGIALCFHSAFTRQVTDRELAALIALSITGSSRRAAETIGITQTALNRSLAVFTARVRRPLFETAPTKRLSDWATEAAAKARRALLEIAEAEKRLRERQRGGQTPVRLRIGALPASRVHLVPQAVRRFAAGVPTSEISIVDGRYEMLLSQLHAGELDLIVGSIRRPNFPYWAGVETLFEDHLVAVSHPGHPLQSLPEVDWWDLRSARWVLPSRSTPIRREFDRLVDLHAIPAPAHVVEVDSFIAARAFLLGGDWLGIFSASQIIAEERASLLKRLPMSTLGECRQVGVITRRNERSTPALLRFLDRLREVASDLSSNLDRSDEAHDRTPKLMSPDTN